MALLVGAQNLMSNLFGKGAVIVIWDEGEITYVMPHTD
jgi:hypothetical protein